MEAQVGLRVSAFRSAMARVRQQLDYESSSISRLRDKVRRIEEEKSSLQRALGLIDRCIEVVSANGIGKIESIVTAGLQQVFADPTLGCIVEKTESARGYSYRIKTRHGTVTGDPMTTFGGGVQNVMAFLLRIIMIKRFRLAKFICLDECFNNINGQRNLSRVSTMLHSLANDYGFTILLITGQTKLAEAATRIYEVVPGDPSPSLRPKTFDGIGEEEAENERTRPDAVLVGVPRKPELYDLAPSRLD